MPPMRDGIEAALGKGGSGGLTHVARIADGHHRTVERQGGGGHAPACPARNTS